MADKKFYWLKLNKDFFDRHEVKIIEAANKEYALFYIKLMCESVSHDGELRFSEKIPYTRKMLASVTNTSLDIVEGAMDLLIELGLVDYLDDGTFFMVKVPIMTGHETAWAAKKRAYRETKEGQSEDNVLGMSQIKGTESDKSIEYRDKSIEYRDNIYSTVNNNSNLSINSTVEEEDRSSASAPQPEMSFYDHITEIWNRQECTKNILSIKPLTKREDMIRKCLLEADEQTFLGTIEAIDHMAFFQKRKADNNPITFDWFVNPDNFRKVLEGNYTQARGNKEGMVWI